MRTDERRLGEIEHVYRSRFREFLRVAIAITGDYQRALDAVQEGFGDAIRSRASFRGDGPLDGWIWRSVVNASRDARRAQRDEGVLTADPAGRSNGHPELSPDVRAAVAALPERQRLVLFLRHYADLDYASIGTALGIRTGTVSATLSHAYARLRRALEEVEA